MEHSKKAFKILFFAIFFLSTIKLSFSLGNGTELCIEEEKQSLLRFKKSLDDPSNMLSSWDADHDCCNWEKVVCDNSTGHVLELKLQSTDWNSTLGGKIDPSFINLKFLRFLDLSQNNFDGIRIPDFFGSLVSLEYLNISYCGFQVDNLQWLSNLTHLEYLDLTYVNMRKVNDWLDIMNTLPSLIELILSDCYLDHFSLIDRPNFTSLVVLDLSNNNFKSLVPDWIFSLTRLESLQLQRNMFEEPIPNATHGLANLRFLDLSQNMIKSIIPDWLFSCSNLESLSLGTNFLHGTISNKIANLRSLRSLDLFNNKLSGQIPTEVGKLCNLQILDLSYNRLEGNISEIFGMSECFSASIEKLNVWGNRLSGLLPEQLGELKNLQSLNLGGNLFTGQIPASLGNLSSLITMALENNKLTGNLPQSFDQLSSLQSLYLRHNKLTGNFPQSFGQLSSLRRLYIDDNMLEGIVTENHFSNLTNLFIISAAGNSLTLKVNQDWIPPFQLKVISLNSWNLGPQIPTWLQTQREVLFLDLSSTGISGEIPTWFWNLSTMTYINISHNELHGQLPDVISPSWSAIYMSSNKFSGQLPRITSALVELDLSNNSFSGGISHVLCNESEHLNSLIILHLGGNQLSGEIPDCWVNWPRLRFINIGNNNMSGAIPRSLGMLGNLSSLNLFGNSLSGVIPSALQNCSMLIKMDLSRNNLVGNFPGWIGTSLSKLRILIMHSNSFNGEIPPDICQLNFLHILDLASNNFSGSVPNCLNNLTALSSETKLMNFSGEITDYSNFWGVFMESASVTTKGKKLEYDTILSQFSIIDLSNNNLSGEIPKEITILAGLRSLNLSRNVLSGRITENIGEMRVLESLDLSRNHISGEIPISISSLTFLSYLNLSYNYLTGRIPLGPQLQSFDESFSTGNELCGPPLKNTCATDDKTSSSETEEHYAGPENEIDWFYVFMALGFATGFGGFCATFLYNRTGRNAYFQFLDDKFFNKLGMY